MKALPFASLWLAFVICVLSAQSACADFLVDPAGGTVLIADDVTHQDEVSSGRALGFSGQFFGTTATTVDVSTNGNLNFSGDANFANFPLPDQNSVPRINPLWSTLTINQGDGARVSESRNTGVYYAVTWMNLESGDGSAGRQSFQATWFGSATTVKGFSFLPDDIAFSYQALDAPFGGGSQSATVGLDAGNGSDFSALPGTSDGVISDSSKNLVPLQQGSFVLFRPNDEGSYDASIEMTSTPAPVPEPRSSLILTVGFALCGLLLLRKAWTRSDRGTRPPQSA